MVDQRKYEDLIVTPPEAADTLERQGFVGDVLEAQLERFLDDPHHAAHRIIALHMIAVASDSPQNLGDVYHAVRDIADIMEPLDHKRVRWTKWQLRREVALIKDGVSYDDFEAHNPRPDYWEGIWE